MTEYWLVDAFTSDDAKGNPAAVFLLDHDIPDDDKQKIATALNLSETVFALPQGPNSYSVRWFTPFCEVFLCGHGTLATSHVLWEQGLASDAPIQYSSPSGPLAAAKTADGGVTLNFPLLPGVPRNDYIPALADIVHGDVTEAQANDEYIIARVENEDAVRTCRPDLDKLRGLKEPGLIVTAAPATRAGSDYIYRVFCPKEGIDEDPVTGSAQTILAPFWQDRLHKTALNSFQASARGGRMTAEPAGERIFITGKAVIVSREDYPLITSGPGKTASPPLPQAC